MTERNPYSQYSFDSYDQRRGARRSRPEPEGFFEALKARMTRPVFAAGALLLTLAAFAGIIAISYPGSESAEEVPIIRADAGDIRIAPPEGGGVDMPHRDSTVFSSIRPAELNETPPVENLAAAEEPVNKLDAFAKEAEALFNENQAGTEPAAGGTEITETIGTSEETPDAEEVAGAAVTEPAEEIDVLAAAAQTAETKTLPVKAEKISAADLMAAAEREKSEAETAPAVAHAAGEAPDTLAYVKSILDEKDGKKTPATETSSSSSSSSSTSALNTRNDVTTAPVERIEPAAGAAARAPIKPGSFFIQLGSVTDESKAKGESARLSKTYSGLLQGAAMRVQRADLGEKGTRFRIQAGPMARESATSICNAIKAQKPGGCIVVQ